jgi:transcriptional regulator with XRE-family HTH domain
MAEPKYEFLQLSKLRADKGLTKVELAKKANVSASTLRDAEKRKAKKRETQMKILNALNASDLYDGALDADEYIKEKK